ncbi:hypothetical protein BU26DRAFT_500756 [Trematosphaeria pertusa]|uniref:Uncharacterized protein n=1 Tax=Trematosphaeria pertusa TaxID=390896 RepID=A0A6A6J127_9PLEO|nr:uncharacterized protein BU26DRAFT_500756 [Trematosphaeria pertusa]KAF2255133.1 hypothetical protein BU26DRAFT_500756 [Trematosphaeria pertusa]
MVHFSRRQQTPRMSAPSSHSLKRTLGIHIANAAAARKALTNAVALAKAAQSIMLEGLQNAETSLQSLTEIRIRTEALGAKTQFGGVTEQDLKRRLADYTLHGVNVRKEHETAMDDAWKGWRSAMANIVRAGKAQKDHDEVVRELRRMEVLYRGFKEFEGSVSGVRSSIERENEEVCKEVVAIASASQERLRGALEQMNAHSAAWEWVDDGVRKAAAAARRAITGVE